jgi:hypothetical protein
VPLAVLVGLLGLDLAGPDQVLRHGVVPGELPERPLAEVVGPRVADVDDEGRGVDDVGHGEGRAHPAELAIGLGLADDGVIDLADVASHPLDQLMGRLLVDPGRPHRRVQDEVDARADGELAGLLAGGHPAHPVGDDHAVGDLVDRARQRPVGHVRRDRLERTPHPGDKEVVLIVRSDLARVRGRRDLDPDRRPGSIGALPGRADADVLERLGGADLR